MPLIRRIPKRGFNNAAFATRYVPVNLAELNDFEDGAVVDAEALRAKGLAKGVGLGVKVLGRGQLQRRLTVRAAAFSASAKEAIEKLGGATEIA